DIKRLYNHYHNIKNRHSGKFDKSIPSFIRAFNGKEIRLHKVKDIIYSGKKQVFMLKLEDGKFIKATANHKFLTRDGWKQLKQLGVGEEVMCDKLKPSKNGRKTIKLYDIQLKVNNHPFMQGRNQVEVHRLIYESYINKLKFTEYLDILLNEPERAKSLKFIDPSVYHIHHKDECHYNNSIENLQLMKVEEHLKVHGIAEGYKNFSQGIPVFTKIESIIPLEVEDVYDIECEEPHHNFVANGIIVHNSGKSFALKLIRQLIDPSSLKLLSMAKDKTELYQQLGHHYLPIFDNVTSLSKEYSDLFCKVVTGEGFSKRQLYTDDEDIIYNYIRKLGFNGINLAGEEPDFLDRSVPVNLSRITRTARKTEAQILQEFELVRPKITGAIFKIMQKTMPLIEGITSEIKSLPRMADYAIWCEAASRVLGEKTGIFLDAYFNKIEGVNRESIDASPVAVTVLEFMKTRNEWEGTASELLNNLNTMAEQLKINTHQPQGVWPSAPNILTKKLNDVRANLEDAGYKIFPGKNHGGRTILISKQKPLNYKEEEKMVAAKKLAMEIAEIDKKEIEKLK
ncbi:MAG: hypothetical protein IMZ60_01270, partial [Actinobacteria bacterium]|nr:hypothetical protein [Actinomycetota bacterium]